MAGSLSVSCLVLAGLFTLAAALQGCSNLDVDSEWNSGMSADLVITTDQAKHGWSLELTWDHPLDSFEQWSGTASSSDKQTWTIVNTNDDLTAGGSLDIRMLLGFSSHPELISAYLDGADVCGGGSEDKTTTTPRTTTTTVPTTTTPCEGSCPVITTPLTTTTVDQGYKPDYPAKYDYAEVMDKSLLFYEAQRSGPLPADNRVPWRGDSALDDAVTGGYYDAGDLVKFGFPMAATITVLSWGGISFMAGYEAAGLTSRLSEAIHWGTDYFIKCHTSDFEFIGQIGDGYADHAVWDKPENLNMARPAFSITSGSPGSDLAGETAAALASSAIYFRTVGEEDYAEECLEHAKTLFQFADQYRGKYTDTIPAGGFYESWSGYNDELAWASAWIAKATGEQADIDKAEAVWAEVGGANANPGEVSWDDKWAMTFLVMYDLTGKEEYRNKAEEFMSYLLALGTTPAGLVWIDSSQWGSLRYAGNFAMWAMQAGHLGISPQEAFGFAEQQMNYALGDAGHSYVCGFGNSPPERPHHRAASCPDSGPCGWDYYYSGSPNPHVLTGALVGGPGGNDQWADDRTNYATNEVTTDYNAGFQSAIAGLKQAFN